MPICDFVRNYWVRRCNHRILGYSWRRIPIMLYGIKNRIKNWSRIHILGKTNEIVLLTHRMSLNWSQEAKCCLDKSGIGSGSKSEVIFNMIFKSLMDTFYQEAFRDINRDGSKLRTFAKLNTDIGIAKYLTHSI